MKKQYIKDLTEGIDVDDYFMVNINSVNAQAKNNLFRVNGTLSDKSGKVPFVYFDVSKLDVEHLQINNIAKIKGKLGFSKYLNGQEVRVYDSAKESEYDVDDFIIKSLLSVDDMVNELKEIIRDISDEQFKGLLQAFFKKHIKQFSNAPASSGNHHNWKHGLLQHTIEVTKMAKSMALASNVPVNTNLIITGSLLHDIGKAEEFVISEEGRITRTRRGELIGHINIAMGMILEIINEYKIKNIFDEKHEDYLVHALLSHHGKLEWASPVEPSIPEAEIIHFADNLTVILYTHGKEKDNGTSDSVKSRTLDKFIYTKWFDDD